MSNPNQPYNNEGFGWAFLWVIIMFLVVPTFIMLSIDNGFTKFYEMRGVTGDCWENSKHERVCYNPDPEEGEKLAECKFWRNFCIEEVYRWRANDK